MPRSATLHTKALKRVCALAVVNGQNGWMNLRLYNSLCRTKAQIDSSLIGVWVSCLPGPHPWRCIKNTIKQTSMSMAYYYRPSSPMPSCRSCHNECHIGVSFDLLQPSCAVRQLLHWQGTPTLTPPLPFVCLASHRHTQCVIGMCSF